MPQPVRILCAGDIHLGRRPSGVSVEESELAVGHVWERLVQRALDEQVDAVVLTGDTVDEENKVFEAMRALENGVRRLVSDGIEVIAVAGNHDYDAFPRLLRSLGDVPLRLLGRNGTWDTYTLKIEGAPRVQFVGWSFPRRHVHTSPMEDFPSEALAGRERLPTLGVLHCEAGQLDSPYAPVKRRALAGAPVEGWLMGHIHAPDERYESGQLQLYTGSLQPLHQGEPGLHGAWMVEVGSGGAVNAEALPLASLRYAGVSVSVGGHESTDEVEQASSAAIREAVKGMEEEMPHLKRVILRLRLEGRTPLGRQIEKWAPGYAEAFETSYAGANASLNGHTTALRPDYDLEEIAGSSDAPGTVAQLLLDLEEGRDTALVSKALSRAKSAMRQVHQSSGYDALQRAPDYQAPPTQEEVRTRVRRQGLLLLDELLDQDQATYHV